MKNTGTKRLDSAGGKSNRQILSTEARDPRAMPLELFRKKLEEMDLAENAEKTKKVQSS